MEGYASEAGEAEAGEAEEGMKAWLRRLLGVQHEIDRLTLELRVAENNATRWAWQAGELSDKLRSANERVQEAWAVIEHLEERLKHARQA